MLLKLKTLLCTTFMSTGVFLFCSGAMQDTQVSTSPEHKTHAASYLSARHAQMNRDWDAASSYWGAVLSQDPSNDELANLRNRAALTALAAGNYDKAVTFAKASYTDNPEGMTVFDYMILSAQDFKDGDVKSALKLLDDIKDEAFQALVIPTIKNYLEESDGTEVERYGRALSDLAKLFLNEGRRDSTLLFARLAAFVNPDAEDTNALLADTLFNNSDYEAALQYYRNITGDIEDFTRAQLLAARSLQKLDRTEEAISLLNDLTKETDSADVYYELADYYRLDKNYQKAIQTYTHLFNSFKGEELPERYAFAYYLRGISYERENKWDAAERDFLKALEFFPDNPDILNYLGYGWIDRGMNIDEGEKMIRKALEINPEDGYITDSLGWVLYKKGEFAEALKYMEKAVAFEPYDSIINDHLGDVYWAVGRHQEARYQWTRALNYKSEASDSIDTVTLKKKIESGLEKGFDKDFASAKTN